MQPPCTCKLPSQRSATCRGILWVWSPMSCMLNLGIFPDCNCNWFFKSTGKNSVFDVKHSCIYHNEGLFQRCKAFQSPAMHCSGKHYGHFVLQRVMCSYGLYSLSDLFEQREELFCIRAAILNLRCFGEEEMQWRTELGHNFRMPRFFSWYAYCFCKAGSHI